MISKLTSLEHSPAIQESNPTHASQNEVKSPYELQMQRVFGSSEKKGGGYGPEDAPERTPEQIYSSPGDADEEEEIVGNGSEFTLPDEVKQAYAKLKAVTEEQYESMTTNIFSHASSVDCGNNAPKL